MKTKPDIAGRVEIVLRTYENRKKTKNKSFSVYDTTMDEVVDIIKEAIEKRIEEQKKETGT